jgi:hypothetical protein
MQLQFLHRQERKLMNRGDLYFLDYGLVKAEYHFGGIPVNNEQIKWVIS